MQSSQIPSGTPAPYGRACVNCSHAKCKCVLLATGSGCERCHRLNKECRPSIPVRKRGKRPSASSRTAHLEAKLDNIVMMLQSGGPPSGLAVDWELTNASERQNATQGPAVEASSHAIMSAGIPSPCTTNSPSTHPSPLDLYSSVPISPEAAEDILNRFRTQNLKYLPIAYIPPHVTSQQLRQEKPFLWTCMTAVLTPETKEREIQFKKINELINQLVFVDHAINMDILLGIMTFISWTTYSRKPFLNFHAHVVMGIINDLGIDKEIPKEHTTLQAFKCAVGLYPRTPTARTVEERRAVLGCFLLTSSIALAMFRIDALRWTPHMEESLSILMDAKECIEDELLVSLVKIQLVVDRVYHLRRDGDTQAPMAFYTQAFQSQLDAAKSQIPTHLQQHGAVLMHLANAELTIHDIAIRTPALPNSPDLHRLESLYASLQASKAWLDHWNAIPPENYIGISFVLFFQFCRAIVDLYKLSTLEDPAWDKNMVRGTANILEILDHIRCNLRKSAEQIASQNDPELNVFNTGLKMVMSLRQAWEPKIMEVWYPGVACNGVESDISQADSALADVAPLSGFDEAWMMEILGSM